MPSSIIRFFGAGVAVMHPSNIQPQIAIDRNRFAVPGPYEGIVFADINIGEAVALPK